ncbi:TlpA family protein disulfide reductase [Myceligenerans pegani]|uniref:TlpA family protein disulfide reductase n=1 Tax=Myceligenerans pegani TaxID=2776917 RepID=A0ABR9N4N8_9MICO|nr:TlpA disulfide reductase family protein [Myceligenerans sp. TRM 65318]MBE1878624.1 TlpA family protein disulfide reductase [Myceligenerans sp. TRM 65318]MBE3020895.1 TlpA family protein disulfide reductase [Myceligenerans sp. TRM 65318]
MNPVTAAPARAVPPAGTTDRRATTGPGPAGTSHAPRRRAPRLAAALLAATAAATLAACTAAADSGAGDVAGQGYVSGDGSVQSWDVGDRRGPVEITGDDFTGEERSTADWAGDVVVLNTWYAGCPPCRAEAPDLTDLANAYEDDGVHFLGINTEDDAATAQAFERTFDTPYPSLEDRDGRVIADLSGVVPLQAVPTTVVLDGEGMVAARVIGQVERSTLETLVDDVLAEDA